MKKLYLVTSKSFSAYVVAEDFNEAESIFKRDFSPGGYIPSGYGKEVDREVVDVKLIARQGIPMMCSVSNPGFLL